jgi:hypothetical protein
LHGVLADNCRHCNSQLPRGAKGARKKAARLSFFNHEVSIIGFERIIKLKNFNVCDNYVQRIQQLKRGKAISKIYSNR